MSKKYDIITIGGATKDIMFYSGEGELLSAGNPTKQKLLAFEYGAKIMIDKLHFTFGGGAANAGIAFAKLGLKTAVSCKVGDDENGQTIINNFKKNKVDVGLVKADKKFATGFSVILTVNNAGREHIAFLHRGANDSLSAGDLPKLEADWLYITSLPKNSWIGIMTAILKQNKKIFWNPGARQLEQISALKRFLPKIKILMVNRDEALEFKKLKDIKGLLNYIKGLGPEIVIITDGERGAYVFDGKKYYFMKAKGANNVDTIGVGDSFGSAFTAALIYGKSIKEALDWGMKNSAANVAHIGAQIGLLSISQIKR